MSFRATRVRRVVQVGFFVLILYAAFLIPHGLDTPLPRIKSGEPRTTLYSRDRILWVSGQESVVDLYLPILACRFVADGGFFKSCSVHVLSENITWRTAFRVLLPHLAWVAVLSFLFARMWCGWACPLGAVQDGATWVRRALGISPWRLTPRWNRLLGDMAHVLLWLSIAIAALIALPAAGRSGVNDSLFLFYCQICPGRIVYPLLGGVNPCWTDWSTSITAFMTVMGWLFLGLFLLSFKVPRLWCRTCAVGALLSYFNRGSATTLKKTPQRCTYCGTCRRVCPTDVARVYESREGGVVTDPACTLCLRCVEACPEAGCLHADIAGITVIRS